MFAHPVEAEVARMFDDAGVRWEYESRTLVLERDDDGRVREAFVPDFYLPDLDLFVELTVMKRRLTGRKRRKARRATALHGVDVQIMYRDDVERLASRWRLGGLALALQRAA